MINHGMRFLKTTFLFTTLFTGCTLDQGACGSVVGLLPVHFAMYPRHVKAYGIVLEE